MEASPWMGGMMNGASFAACFFSASASPSTMPTDALMASTEAEFFTASRSLLT